MKFSLLSLSFVVLMLFACGKKIDAVSYWDCNKSQNLDSAGAANKLTGSWKWTRRDCLDNNRSSPPDKNIIVEFKADSTFRVIQDTSTLTNGSWRLIPFENGVFDLGLSDNSVFLTGHVLFCENEVLFYYSYVDGCDHLFTRN